MTKQLIKTDEVRLSSTIRDAEKVVDLINAIISAYNAKTGETDHTKPEQTDHLFSWRDF